MRLIEMAAAMSLATDVGTGQPLEHALRTTYLAVRAGDQLGVSPAERSAIIYTTLLRFVGCTSTASETAALAGGDDIAFNATMASVTMAGAGEELPHLLRHLGEDLPLPQRLGRLATAMSDPRGKARTLSAHCEVGARLATRIGLPALVATGVAHAYERWDGKGLPDGLAGDAIPLATRVAAVARDVDLLHASRAWDGTAPVLKRRRGGAYDPSVVDAFAVNGPAWLAELDGLDPWDAVVAAEPDPVIDVSADRLDDALTAFADLADQKSPWLLGHSRAVAELAGTAARARGLDPSDVARVRSAGLVHDLGVVGVPAGVLNRSGPLTTAGWERVRLHPYLGERILRRCAALAHLADDVGAHHERVDGSGYHRGTRELSVTAELVAAAEVYQALREVRPHRPALAPDDARRLLAQQADGGRFGRAAVDAVLAGAAHPASVPNVARPAGLTEREVDVLRLIVRGRSNKEVARALGISAKTVGTHVEHIYAKASVTTRAGATLFAMEHSLIRLDGEVG